jgi:hypothetical protein
MVPMVPENQRRLLSSASANRATSVAMAAVPFPSTGYFAPGCTLPITVVATCNDRAFLRTASFAVTIFLEGMDSGTSLILVYYHIKVLVYNSFAFPDSITLLNSNLSLFQIQMYARVKFWF